MSAFGSQEPVARLLLERLDEREKALKSVIEGQMEDQLPTLVRGEIDLIRASSDPTRTFRELIIDIQMKREIVALGDTSAVDEGAAYEVWLSVVRALAATYAPERHWEEGRWTW